MAERWVEIQGTGGRYDVSDQGRVRSNGWEFTRSDGRRGRSVPKLLSNRPSHSGGYVMVNLSLPDDKHRHAHVHHLVLEAFVGPRPEGLYGCHNNGDPTDNRVENLRWDTPASNSLDKVGHGRDHNASKTHCGACGFALSGENVASHGPGGRWRRCVNCRKRYEAANYQRIKEKRSA